MVRRVAVPNGQAHVSPEGHLAGVANAIEHWQRVEVGAKCLSLAGPHSRAKGAMFFIDKIGHVGGD